MMTPATTTTVPYRLERMGIVMEPLPGEELEAEGVLNPASGRGPDGELYLLPRLVATGNVSRVGLARVEIVDGVPVGVSREGVVLSPTAVSSGVRTTPASKIRGSRSSPTSACTS